MILFVDILSRGIGIHWKQVDQQITFVMILCYETVCNSSRIDNVLCSCMVDSSLS